MALGAITVANRVGHDVRMVSYDLISFAADGAYPTGGTPGFQALVRAAVGRGSLTVLGVIAQDCGGYVPYYDKANDKLIVYYVNNDGGADGPMIEVPNATDLDAVTFKVLVLSN